jgi:hypothetical protein
MLFAVAVVAADDVMRADPPGQYVESDYLTCLPREKRSGHSGCESRVMRQISGGTQRRIGVIRGLKNRAGSVCGVVLESAGQVTPEAGS